MIIKPNLPGGHVTFCDDIRHEISGKLTLVGVYGGQMIVAGEGPLVIPQICANILFKCSGTSDPFKVTFKILKSDVADPLFSADMDVEPHLLQTSETPPVGADQDAVPILGLGITAQLQNVVIDGPCTLKVRAYVGDDEIRLGALMIQVVPMEMMAETPAS